MPDNTNTAQGYVEYAHRRAKTRSPIFSALERFTFQSVVNWAAMGAVLAAWGKVVGGNPFRASLVGPVGVGWVLIPLAFGNEVANFVIRKSEENPLRARKKRGDGLFKWCVGVVDVRFDGVLEFSVDEFGVNLAGDEGYVELAEAEAPDLRFYSHVGLGIGASGVVFEVEIIFPGVAGTLEDTDDTGKPIESVIDGNVNGLRLSGKRSE